MATLSGSAEFFVFLIAYSGLFKDPDMSETRERFPRNGDYA